MTYDARIVPTMRELASGSLEPTTKSFKSYVGMVRGAPINLFFFAIAYGSAIDAGWLPVSPMQAIIQSLQFSAFMAAIGFWHVRRTRKPSIQQINRLAHLVRLDPTLAPKVGRLSDKDYTFARMQRFILENSARANEIEMDAAIADLEAAVAGDRRA